MTASPQLIDPSVYVSYFFVLPNAFEGPASAQEELEDLFTKAVGEVAGTAPAERVRLVFGPASLSRRLTSVPPQQRADGEDELEVRTIHDAVSLRVSKLRRGQFALGPEAVVPAPHLKALEVEASNYLGKLTAHLAEASPSASDEELRDLGQAFAKVCLPPGEWHSFFLPLVGALVFGPLGELAQLVFVYRQGARVEFPFQITLQELFLCHLKVRNVARNLRERHFKAAKKQGYELKQLIAATHPNRLRLGELQKANDDLTTIRAELVTSICSIENELLTLEVARENFTRALQGSPFEPEAKHLTDLLIDRSSIPLRNQALVDLGYRKATREQATVHFESLDATIDLHDAKQTHLLAIVMAALTCAQVAGLVAVVAGSDFANWPWWVRLVSVLGATGSLSFLSWLLIRRR
jgi:hypothetical protein